jgi:LysM repeat protein
MARLSTSSTGDTISGISIACGVTEAEILELNDLTRAQARGLQVGQRARSRSPMNYSAGTVVF